nr:40S ribosomal protein S19-3-like [Tanacetum cinerariifolium]
MARRIYFRGGLGVGSFYKSYGGSKRNGSAPPHLCKASGGIAHHILQQLQSINIVDFHCKGRYFEVIDDDPQEQLRAVVLYMKVLGNNAGWVSEGICRFIRVTSGSTERSFRRVMQPLAGGGFIQTTIKREHFRRVIEFELEERRAKGLCFRCEEKYKPSHRVCEEANTVRGCIAQMTALVVELQAMKNQDEVYNGLLAAKNAKHVEESKLVALNDLIVKALDDIDILEADVEILDGDVNGV